MFAPILLVNKVSIRIFIAIFIISLGFFLVTSAQARSGKDFVDGASPLPQKRAKSKTVKLKNNDSQSTIPFNIMLPPMASGKKYTAAPITKNQPLKVGVGRDIPTPFAGDLTPHLSWIESADGSLTATLSVTSPEARAIRLALVVHRLPKGVEIRFFNPYEPELVFGPFFAEDILAVHKKASVGHKKESRQEKTRQENQVYWSPVVEGDTIALEVYLPSLERVYDFSVSIPEISHLTLSAHDLHGKNFSDVDLSGTCNIDVSCSDAHSSIRSATAKIIFTENGFSYLCSGTLLNDKETGWIPYFLTANHCLSTADTARTVNSYWLFERATCGGEDPSSVIQLAGGAELLATGATSDFTLLQLKDANIGRLPGIQFAGWSAAALPSTSDIVSIHHPRGDLKKWSRGTAMGFADYGGEVNGTGSHIKVVWYQGTTEGGSSGSAIFDTNNRFRGNLHGGYASCYDQSAPDWYGRFDLTYPKVKRWLKQVAKSLRSGRTVSGRVAENRWKEYKIKVKPNQKLTVKLYRLTDDADLYVRKTSRPNDTNDTDGFDCRPFLGDTQSETCTLTNTANRTVTYFVGIHGYKAARFKLKATRRR